MNTLKHKMVEYLIKRKYPCAEIVNYYNSEPNIYITHDGTGRDIARLTLDEVKEYYAKITAMPIEEMQSLFNEEFEKHENSLFYNQLEAEADIEHWSKMDEWSIDQAVALYFGKNPYIVNIVRIRQIDNLPKTPAFIKKYESHYQLVQTAINSEALTSRSRKDLESSIIQIKPYDYLNWAASKDIKISENFKRAIMLVSNRPTYEDLEKRVSASNKNYPITLKVAIEVVEELGDSINNIKIEHVEEAIKNVINKNYSSYTSFFTNTKIKEIAKALRSPEQARGGAKKQQPKLL